MDLPTQNLHNLPKNTFWLADMPRRLDICSGMIMQFILNFFNEPLINIEVNLKIDRD